VDEVQDYTTEWLKIVMREFLEANGEFVVFGDPKQNVYHRPIDTNGDIRLGVIGGVWNKELTTGRRFTNPRLASLATSFQSSFFKDQVADKIKTESVEVNSLNFQIVNYIDLRANRSFENLISTVINIINDDNNEARDFVVLASYTKLLRNLDYAYRQRTGQTTEVTFVATEPFEKLKKIHNVVDEQHADWKFNRDYEALERARKQQFTTDKRCLKISTIQSFKGWESSSVIVILDEGLLKEKSTFDPMAPETIYTAITRAKENLYIVNYGNIMYNEFFMNQSI
jgi:superfamily I DNA/RNA helicase